MLHPLCRGWVPYLPDYDRCCLKQQNKGRVSVLPRRRSSVVQTKLSAMA